MISQLLQDSIEERTIRQNSRVRDYLLELDTKIIQLRDCSLA